MTRKCRFVLLSLVSIVCLADVALVRASSAPQADRFIVGACTHFSQGKGVLDRNIESIRQAGIVSIRDEVGWGSVERQQARHAGAVRYVRSQGGR